MCLEREKKRWSYIFGGSSLSPSGRFRRRHQQHSLASPFPSDMPLFTNSSTCFTAVNSSHRNSPILSNSHNATAPRFLRFPQVSILNLFLCFALVISTISVLESVHMITMMLDFPFEPLKFVFCYCFISQLQYCQKLILWTSRIMHWSISFFM